MPKAKNPIDEEIGHIMSCLEGLSPASDEYRQTVENLKTLYEAKNKSRLIDWNTVLSVGGNILGLLLILNFERMNVLTSKALGQLLRLR